MEFFELRYYAEYFVSYNADPFDALWISLVVAGALYIVLYALQAIALWTISGREGYKHRWMSFVPILNTYYMGVVSEKNKFYNLPTKSVALALAIVELLLVAGYAFYYSVAGVVYAGGLYSTKTQQISIMGQTQTIYIITGASPRLEQICPWMAWVFNYLDGYVLTWVNLVYILLHVLVVISFFQTYACRRYVLMSLFSVLFPIKPILMFAVRNNRGMNYRDYVRGEQRRRYEMYQQYSNQNGGNGYGGYNPYNGRPSAPPSGDPYSSSGNNSAEDPFDGLGSSGNSSSGKFSTPPDDPFDEFKN